VTALRGCLSEKYSAQGSSVTHLADDQGGTWCGVRPGRTVHTVTCRTCLNAWAAYTPEGQAIVRAAPDRAAAEDAIMAHVVRAVVGAPLTPLPAEVIAAAAARGIDVEGGVDREHE
jgi:hypothetical protein